MLVKDRLLLVMMVKWAAIHGMKFGKAPEAGNLGYFYPIPLFVLRLLSRINMLGARIFRYAPMLTSGKVNEIRHDKWVCDNSDIVSRTTWKPSKNLKEGVKDST